MKRFIALVLSLVMALSLCAPAWGAMPEAVDGVITLTGDVTVEKAVIDDDIYNATYSGTRGESDDPADGELFYNPYANNITSHNFIMGSAANPADITLNGSYTGSKAVLLIGQLTVANGAGVYGCDEEVLPWRNVNVNGGYTFGVGYSTSQKVDATFDGTTPIAQMDLASGAEMARFGHILVGSDDHDKGENAYVMNIASGATLKDFAQLTTRGDGTVNVDGTMTSFTTKSYQSSSAAATWMHENAKDGGHSNNNGVINVSDSGSIKIDSMNVGRKPSLNTGNAELNVDGGSFAFTNYVKVGYDSSARIGEINLSNGAKFISEPSSYVLQYNNGREAGIETVNKAAGTLTVGVEATGVVTMDASSTISVGSITVGEKGSIVIDASGYAGSSKKVIEQTSADAASLEGKVTVNNLPASYGVSYADGDVTITSAVATANGVPYMTLQAAIDAVEATGGGTVKLLSDVTISNWINMDEPGTYIIDGMGHKVTSDSDAINALFMFGNSGTGWEDTSKLDTHNYTVKNVVFDGCTTEHVVRVQCVTASVVDCTFKNCVPNGSYFGLINTTSNATVTVDGCTFEKNSGPILMMFDDSAAENTLTINDCTFKENEVSEGIVIQFAGDGAAKVTDSTFTKNIATAPVGSGKHAAVVYGSVVDASGNTFEENAVTAGDKRAGVIVADAGKIEKNAFSGNTQTSLVEGTTYVATVVSKGDPDTALNANANYWDGTAPDVANVKGNDVTADTYYKTYADGKLSDLFGPVVAMIGSVEYDDLQEAVDAVADNGTITIKANDLSAVVKTAKTFTVEYAEGVTKATITAAKGLVITEDKGVYTVSVYVAPPTTDVPAVDIEAEVAAPSVETTVDTSDKSEAEQEVIKDVADALQNDNAVKFDETTNNTLSDEAEKIADEKVTVTDDHIDDLNELFTETVTEDDVAVVVQTNFEVKIEDVTVKDGETTVTLDITPVYQKVVTTKDVAEDSTIEIVTKGDEQNAVVVEKGELKITAPVEIIIQIPAALAVSDGANGYKPLYVTHTKDNGTKYVYEAKVEKDGEVYTATFTNPNGFSSFSISVTDSTVVSVDGMNYADLQSAINDLGKNATIEVMQSGLKAEVKGEMSFKVKLADGVTAPTITVANGYNLTKWYFNGVYTYTVTKASAGGYYPSTPATPSKPVQSAGTFDAGIGLYVGMSVMAAAGSAVVIGKKKD